MVYEDELQVIKELEPFLAKLGIPFRIDDIGSGEGTKFPALLCTFRYTTFNFDVIMYTVGKWIHVKCMVMKTENFTHDLKLKTYEICLELNYNLPECTFSVSDGNIFIEMDALVGIDYDDFSAEFRSIGTGIRQYIDRIQTDLGLSIESTDGRITHT